MDFIFLIKLILELLNANPTVSIVLSIFFLTGIYFLIKKLFKDYFDKVFNYFNQHTSSIDQIKKDLSDLNKHSTETLKELKDILHQTHVELSRLSDKLHNIKSDSDSDSEKIITLLHEIDKNLSKLDEKIKLVYALIDKLEV